MFRDENYYVSVRRRVCLARKYELARAFVARYVVASLPIPSLKPPMIFPQKPFMGLLEYLLRSPLRKWAEAANAMVMKAAPAMAGLLSTNQPFER